MNTIIKRLLDILLSLFGLLVVAPLLPVVALLIKLDTKGPVFFACDRVGKDRKHFRMYKFRTMVETPKKVGQSVSPQGDVRVTRIGRLLRRTKINELPQLFNILNGEMSFVGPRPEAVDLAELYPPESNIVFSIKPGLVGPSQAKFRNEEELYPEGANPKKFYIAHILPEKLKIDMEYVGNPTLGKYFYYILLAVKETLLGVLNRRHFFENRAQFWLFGIDMVFVVASYYYAIELRFGGTIPPELTEIFLEVLPIIVVFRLACFIGFGLYGVLIRYLNLFNYIQVMKAVAVSSLLTAVTVYFVGLQAFPRSILVIDWFILSFMMIFVRFPGKLLRMAFSGKADTSKPGVLIYGACPNGVRASQYIGEHATLLGFLDDDPAVKNKKLREYPVLGNKYDIEPLSKIYPVDEVVIAAPDIDKTTLDSIFRLCHQADLECTIYKDVDEDLNGNEKEDYLAHDRLRLTAGVVDEPFRRDRVNGYFENKRLMLVGTSPRMAGELGDLLKTVGLKRLHVAETHEHFLEPALQWTAKGGAAGTPPTVSIEDDPMRALADLDQKGLLPDALFYMGTRKYPYRLSVKPLEVVADNIVKPLELLSRFGWGADRMFLYGSSVTAITTDHFIQKTLMLAETYLGHYAGHKGPRIGILRLPSLLDNDGAVVEQIRQQVRDGKAITLNHPDEARYFSTAGETAKFVLHAASLMNGGHARCRVFQYRTTSKTRVSDLADQIFKAYKRNGGAHPAVNSFNVDNAGLWQEDIHLDARRFDDTEFRNVLIEKPPGWPALTSAEIIENLSVYKALVRAGDARGIYDRVEADYARIKKTRDQGSRIKDQKMGITGEDKKIGTRL